MVCQAGSSSLRVSCSNRRDLESFSEVPNARHLPPRAGRLVDADGPGDSGRGPSASHDRRADRRTGPLAGPGADGHAAPRAAAADDRADRSLPAPTRTPIATLPKAAPPVPTALPVSAPTPKASPAQGAFGVHVGSYRKRATADGEARRLGKELALPSRVVGVDLGTKGVWYRVVVGELGSRSEASALRDRLATKGIPDGVVLRLPESPQ